MPRRPSTHVDDPVAVGRRLRKAREAAGVTQRDLSFEGCTAAYISRIEAGARVPSLQILHEFARRLGVRPEYLATGESDPDGPELGASRSRGRAAARATSDAGGGALRGGACGRRLAGGPGTGATRARATGAAPRRRLGNGVALLEQALDSGELRPGRRVGRRKRTRSQLRGTESLRRGLRRLRALPRRGARARRPLRPDPIRATARQRLHRPRRLRPRARDAGRGARPGAPDRRSDVAREPLLVAIARSTSRRASRIAPPSTRSWRSPR